MWTSTDCSPIDFCLQNYNFSTDPQGDGLFFSFYRDASRHDIPALACAGAWKSTIRRSQSMPEAIYYRPFFLIRKGQRIKADIKGPPHLATAPPPCRPGPRAQPSQGLAFPPTVSVVFTFVLNDTFPLQTLMADKDPTSLTPPEDYIPRRRFASLRGTKQSR